MKFDKVINKLTENKAENIYRTKSFIVVQDIYVHKPSTNSSIVFSIDHYTKRTIEKDRDFDCYFKDVEGDDGKRVHTRWSIRKYEA